MKSLQQLAIQLRSSIVHVICALQIDNMQWWQCENIISSQCDVRGCFWQPVIKKAADVQWTQSETNNMTHEKRLPLTKQIDRSI